MGEVDVLLPQETAALMTPRASRSSQQQRLSVGRSAGPVDATEETPREETPNDSDKQANVASEGEEEEEEEEEEDAVAAIHKTKKKHRRGRSKKRKWKPYYKLSWQERRELEERETRRAHRLRDKMFAHGQAVAPYNTTQFLMEDHNVEEPDFDHIHANHNGHRHSTSGSNADHTASTNSHHRQQDSNAETSMMTVADSSDEFYSSPEDEEDFLQKQFVEVYEDIHAERLSSMSKNELVQEYIQLEEKVEELEGKLKEAKMRLNLGDGRCSSSDSGHRHHYHHHSENNNNNSSTDTVDSAVQTLDDVFEEQWQKIEIFKEEIRKLTEENVRLRTHNEHLRSLVEYEEDDDDELEDDDEEEDELVEEDDLSARS